MVKEPNNQKSPTQSAADRGIGDLLGTVLAISVLGRHHRFWQWISERLAAHSPDDLFEGYKFAVRTVLRLLHQHLSLDSSLGLSEDDHFLRARFHGVSLAELTSSCEKTVLLKSLQYESRNLLKARDWNEFEEQWDRFDAAVLTPLNNLRACAQLRPAFQSDFESAISLAARFQIYIFLNDTHRGLPHGYSQPLLPDSVCNMPWSKNERYLNTVFEGYKFAVQFVWSQLLGSDFNSTALARLAGATSWSEFDEYFDIIRSTIIQPLESQVGTGLLDFDNLVLLVADPRDAIKPLLIQNYEEPVLSERQQLDRMFMWYEIEMVDASATVFNGVLTFCTLLAGAADLRRESASESPDPMRVVRLKHPAVQSGKFDYSYGLLLGAFGSLGLSDYSGWLLFYDCCGDYSGFAGSEHQMAERFIGRYQEQSVVNVSEYVIGKDKFLDLMKDNLLSETKEVIFNARDTANRLEAATNKLSTARGMLVELVTQYLHSQFKATSNSEWSVPVANGEIDVLVRDPNGIVMVECRKAAHGDAQQTVKGMLDKANALRQNSELRQTFGFDDSTPIRLQYVTWLPLPQDFYLILAGAGVEVVVLSERISHLSRNARDRLNSAMSQEEAAHDERLVL